MNNIYTIGHILEMYAYYWKNCDISTEKVLSIAAAIRELARSDENYDEKVRI